MLKPHLLPTISKFPNEMSEVRTRIAVSRMRPLSLVLKATLLLPILFILTAGYNPPVVGVLIPIPLDGVIYWSARPDPVEGC